MNHNTSHHRTLITLTIALVWLCMNAASPALAAHTPPTPSSAFPLAMSATPSSFFVTAAATPTMDTTNVSSNSVYTITSRLTPTQTREWFEFAGLLGFLGILLAEPEIVRDAYLFVRNRTRHTFVRSHAQSSST